MFDLFYKKNRNGQLFSYLEENGFRDVQNFVPIYQKFFSLDNNNFNSINLNQKYSINKIIDRETNNKFEIKCHDGSDNILKFKSFFKFSPLLDPVKYMVGKYKSLSEESRTFLPKLESNLCHRKVLDKNNSAYVDSLFSYLSSQLKNSTNFIHGINFFGSFLGIQERFVLNIFDDLEYLHDSEYFHDNNKTLFEVEDFDTSKLLEADTRNYRKKINLEKSIKNLEVETLNDSLFEDVFKLTKKNLDRHNSEIKLDSSELKEEYSKENSGNKDKSAKKTNSTCSSRSSNTNSKDSDDYRENLKINSNKDLNSDIDLLDGESESDYENNDSDESYTNSQKSDYSSMGSEEIINSVVFDFPVQIICLEQLDHTLDSLLDAEEEMTIKEWCSCLFQIIMMLITYQKMFDFTHNDLHTNNIMYIETEKKFLNYKYNNVYYRVPTYGKIYKIIDFGRAIYTFKGKTICSDSYHSQGDAATQFNFEPYFNENKPRLMPNKSFDLCRLGCSLYDYFADDIEEQEQIKHPIAKIVDEWIRDDKKRNMLYKNNGEERYPDFKLYKMIVRTVHNHLPEKQLERPVFKKFESSKRKIKKQKIINIDNMKPMV